MLTEGAARCAGIWTIFGWTVHISIYHMIEVQTNLDVHLVIGRLLVALDRDHLFVDVDGRER